MLCTRSLLTVERDLSDSQLLFSFLIGRLSLKPLGVCGSWAASMVYLKNGKNVLLYCLSRAGPVTLSST